jgi:hypothetical protein
MRIPIDFGTTGRLTLAALLILAGEAGPRPAFADS